MASPMEENDSFKQLMEGLRKGDQDAATEVFHRYAGRLIGLARKRLDSGVRQKVGPEDILQSAYGSFFRRVGEGQFELETWDEMWALLVIITLRKCVKWVARYRAKRREMGKEVALDTRRDEEGGMWEIVGREPTPAEALLLTETVEAMMRNLDERQQRIVMLRLQGHSINEISVDVGTSERTVQRVVSQVRQALEQLCASDVA
jgi:RNA polymerase sigma-70 factor (ECF subfamily)